VPPLDSRVPDSPAHKDRCWLSVDDKRGRRQANGQIGLIFEETVTS
jgi:hypothetical protein